MKKLVTILLILSIGLLAGYRVAPLLGYPQSGDASPGSFVNWESPHVHPLEITPDNLRLLAVNTADNRLEVFDISGSSATPVHVGSIPVGLDPVSVRARTNNEAWVVNRVSDSVSIVDLTTFNVVATLQTEDEPADVVFGGAPQRAFVSTSITDKVMVFDPLDLAAGPIALDIAGEHPRAMAVSADGSKIYVAIFESGNRTTILGSHGQGSVVSDPQSPYTGTNPPPNDGFLFKPPINPTLPVAPPKMGMIVRKNASGSWMDDNLRDWSVLVSGQSAQRTGRVAGWDVLDNDVAVIDTATLSISYLTGLMNINMALAVVPGTGKVTVVGTDATNEIRYESNLKGRFLRVNFATADPTGATAPTVVDLNTHLSYSDTQISAQSNAATASQSLRDRSIGDPRAILWNPSGTQGFVAGMGSNNVTFINSSGARTRAPVRVGEGPTGLALQADRGRLYVLNRFEASISVINTRSVAEVARVPFFDPTPTAIRVGRKHLYNTQTTSGLGHLGCASCHIDARLDRLAWDLGDPAGDMTAFTQNCNYGVENICKDFHPMKGPMLTQTLQDIIGREPHHWRGDKNGFEGFNSLFTKLQGDDVELTAVEVQQFEDFLATIFYPPNPYRNFDNSLPTSLPLTGHFSVGEFVIVGGLARGAPMPSGNAQAGMQSFQFDPAHIAGPGRRGGDVTCRMCHTFQGGDGGDLKFVGNIRRFPLAGSGVFETNAPGPNNERHLMITGVSFADEVRTFKVPQLRNLYTRVGFERTQLRSRSGFGFFHDGGEGLVSFISRFPNMTSDQQVADIVAFMLAFSGSDLPASTLETLTEPPGPRSQDSHAAVGKQVTVNGTNNSDQAVIDRLAQMASLADAGKVGLVAKGRRDGVQRGYTYVGGGVFQSDRALETITTDSLRLNAAAGAEMTFTVVPFGSQTRIGIDRDGDGIYDGDDVVATSSSQVRGSRVHDIRAITYARKSTGWQPVARSISTPRRGH